MVLLARILYILLAILLFGVLIAIHEFGHFITAKLLKVKVNEYSIGMGPALWSRQKGETLYSLRAFPIGGYCAMEGEDEDTGDPRSFIVQKPWKKLIILCAGSFMNLLLGLALAMMVVTVPAPVIYSFADGFAVEGEDGLMVGDRILEVDGQEIKDYPALQAALLANDGEGVDLVIRRDGEEIVYEDLPMYRMDYTYNGSQAHGFGLIFSYSSEMPLTQRIQEGSKLCVEYVQLVWYSITELFSGHVGVNDMAGVIGIVDIVSEAGASAPSAMDGILNVLNIMALIAVNLAVMNMLPIPALDGGRVVFVLLNMILGALFHKQIPTRYEGYVHAITMVLLLILMAFLAFHDVWNIVN